MRIKTMILSLFTIFLLLFLSGCTSNNTNDSWLKNYSPEHSLGAGDNYFWINFPYNQSVKHLTWINESLEEKPVFFVCHRTGCASCTPQADRVKNLGEKYEEYAIFYDLDNPFTGYGESSADILQKYNEAFYYDPNGGSHYIALTGVFTLVNYGGEIKIGWHSWEAPNDMKVSDSTLETWIKDAIYYHHINSEA
jgi:hypothetical protein